MQKMYGGYKTMSEKKSKENRREKEQAPRERKLMKTMEIDMYDDFSVNVRNFPMDHGMALTFFCNALLQVSAYILEQNAKTQSNILMARPGASAEDIIKMSRDN